MFSKLLFAILIFVQTVTIFSFDLDAILTQHQNSLNAVLHMRNLAAQNPYAQPGGIHCYEWLIDTSNTNIQNMQTNATKCVTDASIAKSLATSQAAATRAELIEIEEKISYSFDVCKKKYDEEEPLEFLNCFFTASDDSTEENYKMQVTSNKAAKEYTVQMQNIEAANGTCHDNTLEAYRKASVETDAIFRYCLISGDLPTAEKTTVTPPTTEAEVTTSETPKPEEPAPEIPEDFKNSPHSPVEGIAKVWPFRRLRQSIRGIGH